MSDWISKAADERREKLSAKLAAEERERHLQEEIDATQKHWYQLNQTIIEKIYRGIERHVARATDAGFDVRYEYVSSTNLLICNRKSMFEDFRRVEFKLNYKDGFVLEFFKTWKDGRYSREKKKNRDYSFSAVTEDKILSWIKWVATGSRPFWLI